MPMRESDTILGPARGSVERAHDFALGAVADRMSDVSDYIEEIYLLAPLVGMDPAILLSQSAHETANWTSYWWRLRLNPAGLGITGDPQQNEQSGYWANGTDAARAQIVHMWFYVYGRTDHPSFDVVSPHFSLDPRRTEIPTRWLGSVRTIADLTGKWATDKRYHLKVAAKGNKIFADLPNQQEEPSMALNMTKGLIPLPDMIDDIIDVSKRDQSSNCRGYDWLGHRPDPPEFLVLHRPQSNPDQSISGYFHGRCVPALTDLEQSSITGQFRRFVRRGDAPSGWANGRVSQPYGDALRYLDHYGWDLDRVNRCGEAVEVSGWFMQPGSSNTTREDPISDACLRSLAQWIASRAHDYGIPWDQFPIIVRENNRSYLTWHQEWTIGTLKICPGRILMDLTARLIEMARAIMRSYQTGGVVIPDPSAPAYAPLNVPDFLTPKWINGGEDARFENGVKVFSLRRRWQARVDSPRLQHSGDGAPEVGPVLPAGRSTIGIGLYHSHGEFWILTEWGERLRMADMTDLMLPSYPTEDAA